mmetsp:Transcript_22691/g.52003  ORF Transcript_22691/g.52003 Transcript_22691/m.52003 type:complete len:93 (+) Transcript_22691:128-406(+)
MSPRQLAGSLAMKGPSSERGGRGYVGRAAASPQPVWKARITCPDRTKSCCMPAAGASGGPSASGSSASAGGLLRRDTAPMRQCSVRSWYYKD